ncbi:MAG: AraC family transcriptional regulator [Polyangiales bacterium]
MPKATLASAPPANAARVQIGALVDLVQQRGIAPEALLQRDVSASERVSLPEFQRLLERAITLTQQPALGLECGLRASEASFGLMSPLISHTTTLRHAIQLIVQFHPLLLDDVRIRLDEHLDEARVHCTFPRVHAPSDRGMSEFVVAGLVRTLRSFGCGPEDLRAVCFEHARPAHHEAYRRAFGGAERFAQAFTGVEFARHLLDRPHIHRQPELERLLREQAERGLQSLSRPATCSERVRALVLRHHADMDMERAARELGLSVRSLRRRLQDEGTTFRALSQEVMRDSACTMLRNPELTLQAISHALGFADSVTFHHTFKRWTKLTPTEYRDAQLQ